MHCHHRRPRCRCRVCPCQSIWRDRCLSPLIALDTQAYLKSCTCFSHLNIYCPRYSGIPHISSILDIILHPSKYSSFHTLTYLFPILSSIRRPSSLDLPVFHVHPPIRHPSSLDLPVCVHHHFLLAMALHLRFARFHLPLASDVPPMNQVPIVKPNSSTSEPFVTGHIPLFR